MAKTKDSIIIEKPFGGWISTTSGVASAAGLTSTLEGGENQYAQSTAVSLFRLEKLGHIAPGEVLTALTDASTRINQLPLNGAMASGGNAFIVLANARLVKTDTSVAATSDHYIPSLGAPNHSGHTITTSTNKDVLSLKDASSSMTEYVLVSWEDGTDADISIVTPGSSGTSFTDDDWFSTLSGSGVLTTGVPLKMTQGPDGNVYITNGQYIATAVMSAGTALTSATGNRQALNLGAGWLATGITNYRNYVAIIGHRGTTAAAFTGSTRNESRMWLWDGFSPEPNFIFDIPDNVAYAAFNDNKNLWAFTGGRNNTSKVFVFNGSGFDLMFESGLVVPDSSLRQGGVEIFQDGLHFVGNIGGSGARKYVFQIYKGGFHNRLIVTDGTNTATDVGMCKNLFQNKLYVGATISGPAYKVYYQSEFSNSYVNADFRTKLYDLPLKSTIRKITVYFSQFGSSSSLLCSLFKNYTAIDIGGTNDVLNTTITTSTFPRASSDLVAVIHKTIPDVSCFYMNLRFNHSAVSDTAAIVRAVVVEYEPSGKP